MNTATWMDETCDLIERVGEEHGWGGKWTRESGKNWQWASTGSRYCELSRERDDEDGRPEYQTVTIRVADHGTCYCSEQWSIVMDGGNGDDHTIEALLDHLRSEFVAD